jgi:hypothetical protein
MDEMCCSDMIRKYTSMNNRWGFDTPLSRQNSQVAAVLSIGVRIPQETVIERMSGSNPVLTTNLVD